MLLSVLAEYAKYAFSVLAEYAKGLIYMIGNMFYLLFLASEVQYTLDDSQLINLELMSL